MDHHTTRTDGCALPETDRERLTRRGHTGIAELLDGLDAAQAAGETAVELVDADGMTVRVQMAWEGA